LFRRDALPVAPAVAGAQAKLKQVLQASAWHLLDQVLLAGAAASAKADAPCCATHQSAETAAGYEEAVQASGARNLCSLCPHGARARDQRPRSAGCVTPAGARRHSAAALIGVSPRDI